MIQEEKWEHGKQAFIGLENWLIRPGSYLITFDSGRVKLRAGITFLKEIK